ncbi:VOC family protein [Streptomyces sp. NBC_01808]|uniref:VOC family protein n=1 Tax=Streptomyces sp. NBC_01808 TaxID=2975947 RepID=UPI002DD7B5C0|nr:VOC family protein [Streptomyces sp. NBC_01808]
MRLEVVVIPVADVDRAKDFYLALGWRLDADVTPDARFRAVQVTPPGSSASVVFGTSVTSQAPGSAQGLHLVVDDIGAAYAELTQLGAGPSEVFHHADTDVRVPGADPEHRGYGSFLSFSDPDGNGWVVMEIATGLPGREDSPARDADEERGSERYRHLPPRIALDDTIATQPATPRHDPDSGRDRDRDFLLHYAAGD